MTTRRELLRMNALLMSVGIAGCGGQPQKSEPTSTTRAETTTTGTVSKPRTLDIRDYGAQVDGSTDDTAAIQSAVEEANAGDTVYFPAGTTVVNSTRESAITLHEGIPRDLTLAGAGESSVLKMASRSSDRKSWIIGVRGNGDPIRGLTIRDMVLDGNRANNPEYTTMGFNLYPGGYGHDIVIRDVRAQNCSASGFVFQGGTVVVQNATGVNNHRQGFSLLLYQETASPAVYLRDVVAENNDSAGIDHHGGVAVVDGFWSENNGNGGAKVTEESHESTWRNGTFKANGTMGFRYNEGRVDHRKQDRDPLLIHLDNVIAVDNPWAGFWLAGDVVYDIGTIAAIRNNSAGKQEGNIVVKQLAKIDAEEVYSSEGAGPGLFYASTRDSQIAEYNHADNLADALTGDELAKLTIENLSNGSIDHLDVPQRTDIGAWSNRPSGKESKER